MIVAAAPVHAPVLAALHAATCPPEEAWTGETFARQLGLPGVFGATAATDGAPVGFVLARAVAGEAEILILTVLPEHRRHGHGGALLRSAMQAAYALGARAMFLEVAGGNTGALALYRAAGFVQVGTRRAYYRDGADALVMRAGLTGGGSESG